MNFLGIDGGGSKTAFLLEDDAGHEIQRIESGPSNWISAGEETARQNIATGIAKLSKPPQIVCGGFAGAGRPEGVRFYKNCLSELLPNAKVLVETDAFISYVGAIGLEPGVLLIAGTGSIAIGRRADGTMIRVGGWGPVFSDEGSGFWIGREAIRHALDANDTGENSSIPSFVPSVCEALQLTSITEVSAAWKSGTLTVRTVAALAALLFQQYPSEPANQILSEAAAKLRNISETAVAKVKVPNCRRSVAGSIGSHAIMRKLIGIEFDDPACPPERGAIIWARSQAQH